MAGQWLRTAGGAVRTAMTWIGTALTGGPLRTFSSTAKPIAELLADMNTLSTARVSRDVAMSVMAVKRGRDEICSLGTLPLVLRRGLDVIDSPLFRQLDPDVPNVIVLTSLIEDLLFEKIGWWQKTSLDFDGFPLSVRYVPAALVSVEPPEREQPPPGRWIWVDGVRTPMSQMIRFDSPNSALLTCGAATIRRAVLLDRLASIYADNPRPLDYFTDTDDPTIEPFGDDEIGPFLAKWKNEVRRSSTAWMPSKVRRVDVNAPSLADLQLVELQRQVTLEISNGLGVSPEDLGVSTTSRTYQNEDARRKDKITRVYKPLMRAITDRLSMGDVTRRGQTVVFDLAEYLEGDPVTQAAYWKALQDMGVTDAAEIRQWAKLPGPPPAAARPVPAAVEQHTRPPLRLGDVTPPTALPRRFSGAPAVTFSAHAFSGAAPAAPTVDATSRTISGLALPYGQIGRSMGEAFRFAPGSLEYGAHVKHFKDHHSPVGNMVSSDDRADGLYVTLSVLSGPDGSAAKGERDQLLYDAAEGLFDGLSVGVDFSVFDAEGNPADAVWNETDQVWDVHRATLKEVSSTSMPAMTDARVTSVAASATGGTMHCIHCGQPHAPGVACATFAERIRAAGQASGTQPNPAPTSPAPPTPPTPGSPPASLPAAPSGPLNAEQFSAWLAASGMSIMPTAAQIGQRAAEVNANPQFATVVTEPSPYRFDRRGNLLRGTHDFSADLFEGWKHGDLAARDRAESFLRTAFSSGEALASEVAQRTGGQFAVTSGNVGALNPNRNRPDLYVDQMDYTYPIWEAINKGTLQDITPFVVPKFSSSSGLVNAHVEGTEPTPGTFVATSQTITPAAVSGKVEYTREAFDQGGNPQASGLIWRQMVRGYYESLEARAVTFLNAQAASISDLLIATAAVDSVLDQALSAAIVPLNFLRGGNRFQTAYTQIDLYKAMVAAKDTNGRRLYPEIGPMNAVGQVSEGYKAIRAHGIDWLPAWALAATGVVPASSWLFDPDGVAGWATPPQRIDIVWRVAWVDIGIWGYAATALLDALKAREVIYDPV